MDSVEINFATNSGYRATEVVADLRNACETLFFPLKMVGYWDLPTGDHLCRQLSLGQTCPHNEKPRENKQVAYRNLAERDLDAVLEVYFPHARVYIYLS